MRRRSPKRGRPIKFSRPPSERDWRGYRLVKMALRVNPASDEATRIITRAIKHLKHRATLSPHLGVGMQLYLERLKRRGELAERHNPRRSSRRSFRHRRNPKRDGTPTRGELRKVKYVQHLKVIAEKGQEARGRIAALTGALPKPESGIFLPLGKRVLAHAESGPRHDDIPQQAPPVVATAPAHPEARNILSRISDIDALLKDYKDQLRELGHSDEVESEVGVIHGEIEKFARQKKALRERLEGLAVATNPRRRGQPSRRGRRLSSERIHQLIRRSHSAAVAIRRVRHHLRRALQVLRARRHR
jgi:hypothetical protein